MTKASYTPRVRIFDVRAQLSQDYSNSGVVGAGVISYEETQAVYDTYCYNDWNDCFDYIFATMRVLDTSYTC
jgi:hypothetical protein